MIENMEGAIRNKQKRNELKREMDMFHIRPAAGILENRYFDMLEADAIELEDIESDISDFEMDIDVLISKLEEFRTKCVALTREFL